jgi:GNAT superfamily N-acetyltransferase
MTRVGTPAAQFTGELLAAIHDRSGFACGSAPLDRYFREQASQDIKRRIATRFVAVDLETRDIAGFYTLTAASVVLDALAPELVKKLPRYPVVPAALLGRLAIATHSQGKGLGAALLADALLRVARVEMGVFAMLVDAKDAAAQRFYEKHGFALLTGEQRRLVLPIATALRALETKSVK